MQAQRRLGEATASVSRLYEQLASGLRINRASDDAAGLAIADDLNAKRRIYAEGIRNGNDGISMLAIADSAVGILTDIATRIQELSVQAANGAYSSKQRQALDAEAQALSKEYFRVSRQATFNGINLFDGSLSGGISLQLGIGTEGALTSGLGGQLGAGTFTSGISFAAGNNGVAQTLRDINGDGIVDIVTASNGTVQVALGSGDGSFGTATSYVMDSLRNFDVALEDINGDGILDLISAGGNGGQGTITYRLGSGNGSFGASTSIAVAATNLTNVALGDMNGDGTIDIVTTSDTSLSILYGQGNGSFSTPATLAIAANLTTDIELADLNNDGSLDIVVTGEKGGGQTFTYTNNQNGTFTGTVYSDHSSNTLAATLQDVNGDGILDLITAGQSGLSGSVSIRLGVGNGTFGAATAYAAEDLVTDVALGDFNGDGILDLVTLGGRNSGRTTDGYYTVRLGTGGGSFGTAKSTNFVTGGGYTGTAHLNVADINGDGVADIIINSTDSSGRTDLRYGDTREGVAPLMQFSLETRSEALEARSLIANTLKNLAKQRSTIGAFQSRLGFAVNNLIAARDEFAAAEARVRDLDTAQAAAELVRTQIVQQSATAILAQANQTPALLLKLLEIPDRRSG